MPCGGDREKGAVSMEEKWDYVVRFVSGTVLMEIHF